MSFVLTNRMLFIFLVVCGLLFTRMILKKVYRMFIFEKLVNETKFF